MRKARLLTRRLPRGSKEIRSRKQWESLSVSEQETYDRVLDAISLARREGVSLLEAAARSGTSPKTVKCYAGSALERRGRKVRAAGGDRLFRRMRALTTEGRKVVDLHGSRVASRVSQHQRAIDRYLRGHGEDELRHVRGKRVGGFELEVDPDALEAAADRDEVRFEDIYAKAA